VAGLGIRLFTDEHVFGTLARELRNRGYDVESCSEAGRADLGLSDADHLEYATGRGRAVLTFDHGDFVRLDVEWKLAGRVHAGIIMPAQVEDIGELLRRVERHLNTHPPEIQHDTLLWLDPTPTQ
jgi:hypothetical protein